MMLDARRVRRSAGRMLLAGVLLAGAGACGDDEDEDEAAVDAPAAEGGSEQAAGGGDDAFCSALVEFNGAVTSVQLDDQSTEEDVKAVGADLAPIWEELSGAAPEDVQAEVEELTPKIDALVEGDASAFREDDAFETYGAMVTKAIPSCDFETVSVDAVDYAFQGLPETLPAGTIAVDFENLSEAEDHEMIVFEKNDPSMSVEELLALPEEEARSMITFAGAAFAPPGEEASALMELAAGEYTVICSIPVGGQEEGPPHFTEGMVTEVTVQ